jgi:excisionase family DNA binding protein
MTDNPDENTPAKETRNHREKIFAFTPRGFDIDAAAHYTSLSRTVLFKAIKENRLTARNIGGRLIFTREDLDNFLDAEAKIKTKALRDTRNATAKRLEAKAAAAAGAGVGDVS